MSQISSSNLRVKEIPKALSEEKEKTPNKISRKYSSTSSDTDSFISNINEEIRNFVENEESLSFSSNSEQESPFKKNDIEYLLDSRFWKASTNSTDDNEFNQEKKIFGIKKLNSEGKKKGKSGYEESYKQSTQENEDEEIRYDPMHNISSSESNNSHLNSFGNNENSENELNSDKISTKNEKMRNNENSNKIMENNLKPINEKDKNDINKQNNKDFSNIIGSNILMNGSNFSNNINFKNINSDSKFVYPYEPINYISNQPGPNYFPNSYISPNYMNFPSKYNLASPLGSRTMISLNNNGENKLGKLMNEKIADNSEQNVKNENINGQNNKLINQINNDFNKKINPNKKDIIDLPIILNQNNNQNISINYNAPKLNLNMTYYPKIPNHSIQMHKHSLDKASSSNLLPELKDTHNFINANISNNINNNVQEKKAKNNNNNIAFEINNINNKLQTNNETINNNNYNYQNIKMKTVFNKNLNNLNNNAKGQKGEKQFLNLDNIASGKDTRTTIMIRNIPIKYTDEILNETFRDFYGKYDCLYMPFDYEKNGNKGYAFINFVNPLHILLFYEKFNGKKWMHFESSKICELNMAHFQGVSEIQKHAKNFKGLKKVNYNKINENIIIPIKYFSKIKSRFPNMKYENRNKKEFLVKSLE